MKETITKKHHKQKKTINTKRSSKNDHQTNYQKNDHQNKKNKNQTKRS